MPYKSEAQRRFFNSPAGKAKIGAEEVEHWNEVSKGKELPEKAIDKAIKSCDKMERRYFTTYEDALRFCRNNKLDSDEISGERSNWYVDVDKNEVKIPIIVEYEFEVWEANDKDRKYITKLKKKSDKLNIAEAKEEFNRYVRNNYNKKHYVKNVRRV